jgi:Fis family transcriptional regulator, factor for inversion stimulation protein
MKPSDLPATLSPSMPAGAETSVSQCVADALRRYLQDLGDAQPAKLYEMVMARVERPMLEVVLAHAGGNRVRAAAMLGINRNTLRKKLQHYGLDD